MIGICEFCGQPFCEECFEGCSHGAYLCPECAAGPAPSCMDCGDDRASRYEAFAPLAPGGFA